MATVFPFFRALRWVLLLLCAVASVVLTIEAESTFLPPYFQLGFLEIYIKALLINEVIYWSYKYNFISTLTGKKI